MSEKISQRILIGELIIIVLPSSLLLLIATILQISLTIDPFPWSLYGWYDLANLIFAFLACLALTSGIIVSLKFLRKGQVGLKNVETKWWIFSFLGGILAAISLFVSLLPPSPEYSAEESFREIFHSFSLGLPLFIPFTHLLLEKYLRKG